MDVRDRRVALLIDADNAPAAKIDLILAEIARHGTACVRRAYGNWKSPRLQGWEAVLHSRAIRPVQQFDYSTNKNATDMAMVVDAMDLLHAHSLDAFAIVTSDADFTPLVMRILTDGLMVYGFGERKAPTPFVNACSRFVYVEGPPGPAQGPTGPAGPAGPATNGGSGENGRRVPAPAKRPATSARLVGVIGTAVDAACGDDGWANLAAVGSQIGGRASLGPPDHGHRKLSDLVEATGAFDVRRDGQRVLVRRTKAHRKVAGQ